MTEHIHDCGSRSYPTATHILAVFMEVHYMMLTQDRIISRYSEYNPIVEWQDCTEKNSINFREIKAWNIEVKKKDLIKNQKVRKFESVSQFKRQPKIL